MQQMHNDYKADTSTFKANQNINVCWENLNSMIQTAISYTTSISHGLTVVVVMDTSQGSEIFLQYEESEESECPTEGSWCCGADLFPH